jgi:hypothetical protein
MHDIEPAELPAMPCLDLRWPPDVSSMGERCRAATATAAMLSSARATLAGPIPDQSGQKTSAGWQIEVPLTEILFRVRASIP